VAHLIGHALTLATENAYGHTQSRQRTPRREMYHKNLRRNIINRRRHERTQTYEHGGHSLRPHGVDSFPVQLEPILHPTHFSTNSALHPTESSTNFMIVASFSYQQKVSDNILTHPTLLHTHHPYILKDIRCSNHILNHVTHDTTSRSVREVFFFLICVRSTH
jgi:hypothetical protein